MYNGAGDRAQYLKQVKCLHEDQSSDSHINAEWLWRPICNVSTWEAETRDKLVAPLWQALSSSERSCLKMENNPERHLTSASGLHMCTRAHTCTHVHGDTHRRKQAHKQKYKHEQSILFEQLYYEKIKFYLIYFKKNCSYTMKSRYKEWLSETLGPWAWCGQIYVGSRIIWVLQGRCTFSFRTDALRA